MNNKNDIIKKSDIHIITQKIHETNLVEKTKASPLESINLKSLRANHVLCLQTIKNNLKL